MSNFFFYLIAFLVVLGVLIVVHEFGHFAVAKLCGVKVLRFSIGFGKPIWSRKFGKDATEWAIGAFPLGGYVKMLDEREAEVALEELHRAFNRKSVAQRSAIVVAGPAANFILAILLYWGLFMSGNIELLAIFGTPPMDSPAAIAGIVNGEQVRSVDGEVVESFENFRWLVLQKAVDQESVELELINEKQEINHRRLPLAAVRAEGWQGDGFKRLGLVFYQFPPVLGKLLPNGVAENAGLRSGDQVLSIDGVPIKTWEEMQGVVEKSAGERLVFTVERDKEILDITVRPKAVEHQGKSFGRIEVYSGQTAQKLTTEIRYGFFKAGSLAFRETWEKSVFSLVMMGKMLTGEVSWRNLSGPVTIADYAGQSAKMGLLYYLKFMALISVSLGVLNLLPIPILDGGHLLYHVAEVINRGPLSERILEIGQQAGLALLLMLMAFAFFNDINRLLSG